MRYGTVVQRRTVAGSGVVSSSSGGTSSPIRASSPPTVYSASAADRPSLTTASSSSSLSVSSVSAAFASSCFDRSSSGNNTYFAYDHHRRRKRRQYQGRGGGGAYYYYYTYFGGMDNNNACFYFMRKYRIVGQWAAVFVVIYLATLLMTHGYHRSLQNKVPRTTTSASSSSTATSLFMHNNNNIAFPTSLMIHNGKNYHLQQQRSHHRRYHTGGKNLRNNYFYNNGSIRPLPPLLRPHQRDDDYMEPNFGGLNLYMLHVSDYDENDYDDDGYNDQQENSDDENNQNRAAGTAEPIMMRREILEEERLDPDRFRNEFRRHGHPRPHYDDHYYHNDQYIEDENKYPENEYYWYYAMDDDVQRNPYNGWEDDNIQNERHCRRVSFHREIQINCNSFHEFDFQGLVTRGESSYVGGGAFRHVFKAAKTHVDDELIFKEAAFTRDHKFDFMDMEAMRMDGVIATAIQPHPLLVDTYGFCALSQFSELMHQGDVEQLSVPYYKRCDKKFQLNDHDDVEPWNDLEPTTKLQWALEMAEAVAVLNNFEHGVIVHDDIQPPQFLPTKEGKLKFNDFNRAEVMLFDEEHQEYCRYRNDVGPADWRAPEEYVDRPLNEKIDVWSLANNFYSLLTGLMPFYEECNFEIIQRRIIERETPYIDPRWRNHSFAEGLLVDIMEKCWEYDPDDRIEIGQLVLLLRQAVAENEKHEALKQEAVQEPK